MSEAIIHIGDFLFVVGEGTVAVICNPAATGMDPIVPTFYPFSSSGFKKHLSGLCSTAAGDTPGFCYDHTIQYAVAMTGKLYTPPRVPGLPEILVRLVIVVALLMTTILVLYFEQGLIDNHTGQAPRFWDCVYFAFITITTVGYGDIVPTTTFSRLTDALLLTPIRFVVLFIFIGTAYQLAVKRFQEEYRMKKAVARLDSHVIICGYGATGDAAVRELLLQGTPADQIVVLAMSEVSLQAAADLGVVAVAGDATRENVLKSVAVEKASHVLICPGRDDTAVLIALTVRDLNPQAHIVSMCHEEENVKLLQRSGAQTIVTPASAGGNLMAAATRRSHLVETMQDMLSVGGGLQLDERPVHDNEVGKASGDLDGLAVVRVYRKGTFYNAGGLPELEKGDVIVFVTGAAGTQEN